LPVSRRGKNIIGAQSTIGRFGLPCLPAGRPAYRQAGLPTGRQAFSVPKSEENKAAGIIADIHIEKSIFPSFREAI